MRPPKFSIRALLVLMLAVAAFFGGIKFERERRIRAERILAVTSLNTAFQVMQQEDAAAMRHCSCNDTETDSD